jgi:hypothetical protein
MSNDISAYHFKTVAENTFGAGLFARTALGWRGAKDRYQARMHVRSVPTGTPDMASASVTPVWLSADSNRRSRMVNTNKWHFDDF